MAPLKPPSLPHLGDLPLQFQITDRLSFKRILWRTHADQSPDGKTFRAFRETLIRHDLLKPLFDIFHAALEPKGLFAGKGQRVDATFVEVPRQRNAREEHATIKAGEVPAAWRDEPEKVPPEGRGRALDASKNDARHSGYKNHVKVDSRVQTH